MSMIKIENLTFSYPTSYDNVFENVSFQVDTVLWAETDEVKQPF